MTTTFPRGTSMPDFDISPSGPLRVAVGRAPAGTVAVRAVDLRDVAHRVSAIRDLQPDAVVVVDIDVVIARDAHLARSALAAGDWVRGDSLLYVGTPAGLAGLVADIHALGLADGAVLHAVAGDDSRELIYREVLPQLPTMTRDSRPA